jgi:hypothetical protein
MRHCGLKERMVWCGMVPLLRSISARGFAEGGGVMQRPSGEPHRQAEQSALLWPLELGTASFSLAGVFGAA